MKRALAERAKQSIPQTSKPPQQPSTANGESPTIASSLSCTDAEAITSQSLNEVHSQAAPPLKIPRISRATIKSEIIHEQTRPDPVSAKDREPHSTAPPASPRIPKTAESNHASRRPSGGSENVHSRKSASRNASATSKQLSNNNGDDHEDEEEDKASAFFLRHQNKALATELKSLQHAVADLTREREIRRQECFNCAQALHSLQATWAAMEAALQIPNTKQKTDSNNNGKMTSHNIDSDTPHSTGEGDSVEWTRALVLALEGLGKSSSSSKRLLADSVTSPKTASALNPHRKRKLPQTEDDSVNAIGVGIEDGSRRSYGIGEFQIASNIEARARVLQEFIWKFLSSNNGLTESARTTAELAKANELLESQKQMLEIQISELVASRKQTFARERRIRRNVYRLAAGMLTAEQVITSTESDEEVATEVETEKQNKIKLDELQKQNDHLASMLSTKATEPDKDNNDPGCQAPIPHAQTDSLMNQIASLKDEVSSLKSVIADLNENLKRKESRITELSLKQLSDKDIEHLQQLEATSTKLRHATDKVEELENALSKTRNNWSKALGNEKAALATIDEMVVKFNKRWTELTGKAFVETTTVDKADSAETDETESLKIKEQASQLIEIQHKLDQALENVRQAESVRSSLKEALILNGSLQSKLDEIKAKYAAVQAQRNNLVSNANRPSVADNPSTHNSKDKANDSASVSTPREKDANSVSEKDLVSSGANSKTEKMYRKVRKDLAAMKEGKEVAKAKLERSEKERESLAESNARLLKQISEKDEVNARSLSTILYLKGQTDVLLAEKSILEQQTKTAGQLALAARLATNAKERVSELVSKEKQPLEEKVERLEAQLSDAKQEFERLASELAEFKGKKSTDDSTLANAEKRINELIAENAEQRERMTDLESAFSKANREAREAKSALLSFKENNMSSYTNSASVTSNKSATAASGFTVEQLNTQISVLKSRLACPVCHERDKQCIIMRCRHMHCQQCVDDQISSRSRKCPTCNNKFSEKDVEDIWLNT